MGSPGLDPDVLLDRPGHLSGERLITGPSYPSVPDAFAVGQNSSQPKERLEGESDRTPHVLACAYGSLAHVQRSSRRFQSMAGLVDTMGLIRPSVPADANPSLCCSTYARGKLDVSAGTVATNAAGRNRGIARTY